MKKLTEREFLLRDRPGSWVPHRWGRCLSRGLKTEGTRKPPIDGHGWQLTPAPEDQCDFWILKRTSSLRPSVVEKRSVEPPQFSSSEARMRRPIVFFPAKINLPATLPLDLNFRSVSPRALGFPTLFSTLIPPFPSWKISD